MRPTTGCELEYLDLVYIYRDVGHQQHPIWQLFVFLGQTRATDGDNLQTLLIT